MEVGFIALIVFILLVTRGKSSVLKGKLGEIKVSYLLQKHLLPSTYQVLNDVTVPSINGTTQIDHVVVSAEFKTTLPEEVCRLSDLVDRIKLKGRYLLSSAEVIAATQAIKTGRLEPGFKTDYEHVRALGERFEGSVQRAGYREKIGSE